jgi:ferredoxin-thioredoxin reductase catalytic subunit
MPIRQEVDRSYLKEAIPCRHVTSALITSRNWKCPWPVPRSDVPSVPFEILE